MSYLVTGGTGFLGAHVVRLLAKDGERVLVYDIAPNKGTLEQIIGEETANGVRIVQGDIADLAHLIETAKEFGVERIIHTAALLGSDCSANPLSAVRVNCEGTINVLETAKLLGLKRVVFASSVAVFGPPEKHKEEYVPNDAPHYPTSIYGASKSFCEICARHYFSEFAVDSIAIRFPAIYGEVQARGLGREIAEELFIKPVQGKPGRVPCGDDKNNWIYIEDAARAMLMAARVDTTRTKAFNVDGDVRSFAEVVNYVKSLIPDADISLLPGHTGYCSKLDTTRIREEVGYRPEWTIEKGISKVITYMRQQY